MTGRRGFMLGSALALLARPASAQTGNDTLTLGGDVKRELTLGVADLRAFDGKAQRHHRARRLPRRVLLARTRQRIEVRILRE
jgi:hypothetical protein